MTKAKKSVDEDLIRNLADLLKETELCEIEIEQDGWRIRLARGGSVGTMVAAPREAAVPAPHVEVTAAEHPGSLKCPMVGTAYLAATPGAAPFVEVGARITEGQTVMIVEAMKTMNHIPAPRSGTITAILIENGQPVEFGEPLMIIE